MCHSVYNFMDFLKLIVASFVRHRFTDLLFAWAPPSQQYPGKQPWLDGVCCPVTTKYLILS